MARRGAMQFCVRLSAIGLMCGACACKTTTTMPSQSPAPSLPPEAMEQVNHAGAPEAVATLPPDDSTAPIGELRVAQEVLLHAALYRAAFAARVGDARHFILEPVSEQYPPNLGIDPADFRQRVLLELSDLHVPVAWTPSSWRTQAADVFPGTDEPATRLTARIISRDEDQATVTAEIGDRTANALSSRQTVTAIWDGAAWRIERGRARVIW